MVVRQGASRSNGFGFSSGTLQSIGKSRATRGFTLVEILVVVGIIALLISMLLPALSKARAASRTVQCLSNMRQIQLATMMYANDNQNWCIFVSWTRWGGATSSVPPLSSADYPNSWDAFPSDSAFLGKYTDPTLVPYQNVGTNPSNYGTKLNPWQIFGYVNKQYGPWRCPEDSRDEQGNSGWQPSYVLDNQVFAQIKIKAGVTPVTGFETMFKYTKIVSASRMMGFIEGTGSGFDPGFNGTQTDGNFYGNINGVGTNSNAGTPGATTNFAIFHLKNKVNVGYMDGHCETLLCSPLTTTKGTAMSLEQNFHGGAFVTHSTDQ